MGVGELIGGSIDLIISFGLGFYFLILYLKPKTKNIFKNLPEIGSFLEKHRWIYLIGAFVGIISGIGTILKSLG